MPNKSSCFKFGQYWAIAIKSTSLTILAAVRNNFSKERQRLANWDIQLPFGGRPLENKMQIILAKVTGKYRYFIQSYHHPMSSSLNCPNPTSISIPWLDKWPLLHKSSERILVRCLFSQRTISSNDPERARFWHEPIHVQEFC